MAIRRSRSGGNQKRDRGPRINHQIKVPEVRLVGDDGHSYGVVGIDEAKRIGQDANLDLVEVSPNASPPVVKLIDYGKFKYEQQKKAKEAKKKQVTINLKEIQFRPNIEEHDLNVKLKRAEKFLDDGDKLKLIMQFRGREMANREIGLEKFNDIIKTIENEHEATIESPPKFMGNRSIVIMAPTKKKN